MLSVNNYETVPKISVVIPAYNAEKYIKRSVESALDQKGVDVEVIVINDGSKDSTSGILHQEYDSDIRVKIFDRDNHGLYKSRIFGISKVSSEYITFIDADDFVIKDLYAGLINQFTEEIDVIEFGITIYDEKHGVIKEDRHVKALWEHDIAIKRIVTKKNCSCSVCNKIFKSKLFKIKQMDIDIKQYEEDMLINIIAMKNANKVLITAQLGYWYCRHSNSITTSQMNPEKMEVLKTWEYIFNEMSSEKCLERFAAVSYCSRLAYYYCLFVVQTGKPNQYDFVKEKFCNIYKRFKLWNYVYTDGESAKRRVMIRLFAISPTVCVKLFKSLTKISSKYLN